MVVGEGDSGGDVQACRFNAGKELLWAGDTAKGRDRTAYSRNLHLAVKPPDRPLESPGAQGGLKLLSPVRRGNGNHGGPASGRDRLAQVARWQQAVFDPVATVKQQNVHVAMKLAMLKAVVQEMNGGQADRGNAGGRFGLGQQAGSKAPPRHIDRHARLARNQQRLVAKLFGGSIRVNARGALAAASIATGEHVHWQAVLCERPGERNGERRFAGAAG